MTNHVFLCVEALNEIHRLVESMFSVHASLGLIRLIFSDMMHFIYLTILFLGIYMLKMYVL